ncbi:MAG: hypothetical protein PHE07_08410, partial [Bacteroidales bacterium]|nr:hypothetical protein [Bacteroidales bacterium]
MQKEKIFLENEMETLLVPLFSKAHEMSNRFPIIIDKKAEEILGRIEYNFADLKIPRQTLITLQACAWVRVRKLEHAPHSFGFLSVQGQHLRALLSRVANWSAAARIATTTGLLLAPASHALCDSRPLELSEG